MREIVWDTETTGFDPFAGDRIVEIGAVELNQHLPTGRVYHQYINPERDMPPGAFEVHGLSIDFLKDFPVFSNIARDFIDFVGDATLIAHNAKPGSWNNRQHRSRRWDEKPERSASLEKSFETV